MTQPRPNEDHAPIRPGGSKSFANLYELLNVAPLEQRPEEIVAAIQRLQRTLPSEPNRETAASRRARKIIELAQTHLLNEQLKQAYDQKWKQHFAARARIAADAPQQMPTSARANGGRGKETGSSDSLFPRGDPEQPFDLPAYVNSIAGEPLPNPELDFQKLQRSLAESELRKQTRSQPSTGAAVAGLAAGAANEEQPVEQRSAQRIASCEPSTRQTSSEKSARLRSVDNGLSSHRVPRGNRRKKDLRWVGAIALIASVGCILLLGYMLFDPFETAKNNVPLASDLLAQSGVDRGSGRPTLPVSGNNSVTDELPRRVGSGLPKPGAGNVAGFGVDLQATEQGSSTISAEPESLPLLPNDTAPPTIPSMAVPADESAAMPAMSVKPENTALPADPIKPEVAVTTPAEPKLSPSERDTWTKAMIAAKNLIGEQDFEAAEKKLSDLTAKTKTAAQKAQHQRLSAINKLAREFCQAMVDTIAGLGAGEVVKVGTSTNAAFVAGSPTAITVRVSGENRRYALNQIPIGLAYALVDLKLDTVHPKSLARKAAFALVHPKSNQSFLEKGRQMMLEAAQAEIVQSDLPQAFDDDYEIAN